VAAALAGGAFAELHGQKCKLLVLQTPQEVMMLLQADKQQGTAGVHDQAVQMSTQV
jgi:hypothetical protein